MGDLGGVQLRYGGLRTVRTALVGEPGGAVERGSARKEAVRLGPVGARACSLSPGIIDTPQGRQEAATHASMQRLIDATPLGRTGSSEDVASVVAFMLSDEAGFLNGIDILVDGGVFAAVRGD